MKRLPLCATIWFCAGCAFAQPAQYAGSGVDPQSARDQRRAELRTALQASRQFEAQNASASEPPRAVRQLSPRELAEMRQQLRQQQVENQQRYRP